MSHKFSIFALLSALLFSACGQEEASLAPVLIVDEALAAEFNQVEFWLFENIGKDETPLNCSDFMKTGAEAINPANYNVAYSGKFVFQLDGENTKDFANVPIGKGYILYVRGYNVISNGQKLMKAHACKYNVSIEANEVTPVSIQLEAVN